MISLASRWACAAALCVPLVAFAADDATEDGFSRMDSDADGRFLAGEHAQGARAMFVAMDTDADAVVTAEEMDAAQVEIHGGSAPKGAPDSASKIAVIDADRDGRLSADEHARGSRAMFARMDRDGDGALDRAEYDAGHARLQGGADAQ